MADDGFDQYRKQGGLHKDYRWSKSDAAKIATLALIIGVASLVILIVLGGQAALLKYNQEHPGLAVGNGLGPVTTLKVPAEAGVPIDSIEIRDYNASNFYYMARGDYIHGNQICVQSRSIIDPGGCFDLTVVKVDNGTRPG